MKWQKAGLWHGVSSGAAAQQPRAVPDGGQVSVTSGTAKQARKRLLTILLRQKSRNPSQNRYLTLSIPLTPALLSSISQVRTMRTQACYRIHCLLMLLGKNFPPIHHHKHQHKGQGEAREAGLTSLYLPAEYSKEIGDAHFSVVPKPNL